MAKALKVDLRRPCVMHTADGFGAQRTGDQPDLRAMLPNGWMTNWRIPDLISQAQHRGRFSSGLRKDPSTMHRPTESEGTEWRRDSQTTHAVAVLKVFGGARDRLARIRCVVA